VTHPTPISQKLHPQVLQPGSTFAVTFILCVISAAALVACIPDSYWSAWLDLTMLVTRAVGGLFDLTVTSKADILTVNGFAMRIIRQCTAIDYVVILSSAMLIYTRHSLSYRLLGLAVAVPAIILVNACRLIISGVVGTVSRRAFDFSHDYFWVIAFALIVFAIWTLWVNGRFSISRQAAWRVGQVAVASLAAYALLLIFHDAYGDLMAKASSLCYRLLDHDPLAAIERQGDAMFFNRAGVSFHVNQVNVAIYVGLMAPLQKKGAWETLALTILGLLCIMLLSVIFIALGCRFAAASGPGALNGFLGIGSIVHLALPMTVYWIMTSGGKKDVR
jgi:exosortase/archaeosortase family protein